MKRTPEPSASSSVQADLYGNEEELEAENHRDAMLCAINGYAAQRGEYEYPLMVCDTSRSQNGKKDLSLPRTTFFIIPFFVRASSILQTLRKSIPAGSCLERAFM